jgi:hypothetical protein
MNKEKGMQKKLLSQVDEFADELKDIKRVFAISREEWIKL